MISLICVNNNNCIFDKFIKDSLSKQVDITFELIVVDNQEKQFDKLSDAYMTGVEKSTGDTLIFLHPDICFLDSRGLRTLISTYNKLYNTERNIGIVGVAGALFGDSKKIETQIKQGPDSHARYSATLNKFSFIEVQTVDACLFICSRQLFLAYSFDCELKGFHLCVEELCLTLNSHGFHNYVVNAPYVWHLSNGASLDWTYYRATLYLLSKFRNVKYVNTTSFHWDNHNYVKIQVFYMMLRAYIHGIIKGRKKR